MLRALITSQAALGHFHPLASVAASLALKGHDVLFATAPCFCDRIRRCGFAAQPAGINWSSQDLSETGPEFSDVPLERRNGWINENLWADRIPRAMLPDFDVQTKVDPADSARIPFAGELPLTSGPPGDYLLEVTATDRTGKVNATQVARITVE